MKDVGIEREALGVLLGGVGLIVGSVLPWATVTSVLGTVNVNGFDKDGRITAVAGALIVVAILATREHRLIGVYIGCIVIAAIGGLTALIDYKSINKAIQDSTNEYAKGTVGIGVYLCGLGAGVAAVAAATNLANRRRPVTVLLPGVAPATRSAPLAGWYPDPYARHHVRFWDGAAWSEHVSSTAGVPGIDPPIDSACEIPPSQLP